MKKTIILILLASIFVTGCGNKKETLSKEKEPLPKRQQNIQEQIKKQEEKEKERKEKQEQYTEEGKVYTMEDAYIISFESGYLSEGEGPPSWRVVVIENEEQLLFAEENYGLRMPEDWPGGFNGTLASAFQKVKTQYPVEEYTYVISYDEVASGGYYFHADRVMIADNKIGFLLDDSSYTPDEGEMVPEVMGGFCHIAAIPKEDFENTHFENALYPGETEESK